MRTKWIAAAAISMLWSQTALAGPLSWRLTEVNGAVQIKRAAQVQRAVEGVELAPGDMLQTGANGRAVLVRGQEIVVVSPATQLRLPGTQPSAGIVQMIQDFGRAIFTVEKKSTPHFQVDTPYLAAIVKGTTFTVAVDEMGGSVKVTQGRVQVRPAKGGAGRIVDAGGVVSVLAANPGSLVAGDLPARASSRAERSQRNSKGEKIQRSGGRANSASAGRAEAAAARANSAAAGQTAKAARDNARTASQQARDAREAVKASRPKKDK